ncbi:MAG: hypothetical protein IPJ20_11980 [Flammeovirgaceae bacterium]|nr:hypothetical protein [Flammeovirgaceae bacterium]
MEYIGVPTADITTYLAQPTLIMPNDEEMAQELIINQKYIANLWRSNESYFDFVRTG